MHILRIWSIVRENVKCTFKAYTSEVVKLCEGSLRPEITFPSIATELRYGILQGGIFWPSSFMQFIKLGVFV